MQQAKPILQSSSNRQQTDKIVCTYLKELKIEIHHSLIKGIFK